MQGRIVFVWMHFKWPPLTRGLSSARARLGERKPFHRFSPSVFCFAKSTSLIRGRLLICGKRKSTCSRKCFSVAEKEGFDPFAVPGSVCGCGLANHRPRQLLLPRCFCHRQRSATSPSRRRSGSALFHQRKTAHPFGCAVFLWRRKRDLNPRDPFEPYSLSRGAPSPLGYFSSCRYRHELVYHSRGQKARGFSYFLPAFCDIIRPSGLRSRRQRRLSPERRPQRAVPW